MDVLPTPPFPPTNITGVSLDVESEDLEEEAVFAISSINGCNEYNRVVDCNDLECTTVLGDGKDLLCVLKVCALGGGGVENRPILNARQDEVANNKKIAMVIMMYCNWCFERETNNITLLLILSDGASIFHVECYGNEEK